MSTRLVDDAFLVNDSEPDVEKEAVTEDGCLLTRLIGLSPGLPYVMSPFHGVVPGTISALKY
jgi:hypothetical protein